MIHIRSLDKGARVTSCNAQNKLITRHFKNSDEAMDFVLPQGSRQGQLDLNGSLTVLHGMGFMELALPLPRWGGSRPGIGSRVAPI